MITETILKPIELDIRKISLDELNDETIEAIREWEENIKKWIKNLSHNDFWNDL